MGLNNHIFMSAVLHLANDNIGNIKLTYLKIASKLISENPAIMETSNKLLLDKEIIKLEQVLALGGKG